MTSKTQNSQVIDISEYIDTYYKEYSIHTNNNRAIPSVVDGLKPVQRKTIYCALKEARNGFKKVSSLAGLLPSVAAYHHGNVPAEDAIVKMSQDFGQNVPLLKGDGTFGTRLVPEAGASRYIFSKMNDNFDLFFKDNQLAPKSLDEDDHPEPFFYLPIIPMVLVNGVTGVSVGFYTNILPRAPKDITNACLNYMNGKRFNKLKPKLQSFDGTFEEIDKGKFSCIGILEHVKGQDYRIREVPLGMNHEKYIEHIDKLNDNGIIRRYTDDSDSKFDIKVTLDKAYADEASHEKMVKDFKLTKTLSETFCVVDDMSKSENDESVESMKIVEYNDEKEIIKDFCDFRLKFYVKRINYNISSLNKEIHELDQKVRFIHEVINGTIQVGKHSKKELFELLVSKSYDENIIERLISMPIYSMTKDNIDSSNSLMKTKQDELQYWNSADSSQLFIEDLKELNSKIKF